MDLFNKIKFIFNNEQEREDEPIKEVIKLEELPRKLEDKTNELATLKKQLKENISKRVSYFEIEINKKIIYLERIDISQRKEYDRIKILVGENLNLYISHLKRTINNIKDAEKNDAWEFISRLFSELNGFNKVSSMPFEKATILIGDELSSTRAVIRSFIQEINKIIEENSFIFEKSKLCDVLDNLLSESKQLTLLHAGIENNLSEMNVLLKNSREEQDGLKSKLLEIQETDSFKRDNQEKLSYRNKLVSLEREIQAIKKELDLKSLLKRFHHDKIIDQLVRNYVNDFKNALEEDKELKIISISNSNDKKHFSRLKEVRDTLISLHPLSPTKTDKEIAFFEDKIKDRVMHMRNLEENIKTELKRKEKLSIKLQKVNSDLMEQSKLLF